VLLTQDACGHRDKLPPDLNLQSACQHKWKKDVKDEDMGNPKEERNIPAPFVPTSINFSVGIKNVGRNHRKKGEVFLRSHLLSGKSGGPTHTNNTSARYHNLLF